MIGCTMKLFSPGSGIVLTTYRIDTITQPFSPIAYCKNFQRKAQKMAPFSFLNFSFIEKLFKIKGLFNQDAPGTKIAELTYKTYDKSRLRVIEGKMKFLLTASISITFVLGLGMFGLFFMFGKMALAYAIKDRIS